MAYVICLKWGGLHGHVAVQQTGGEVLYVLQSSVLRSRRFPVVDANEQELFRVCKGLCLLGSTYKISGAGHIAAVAGSNWLRSRGRVEVAERPVLRCRYGWGFKTTLAIQDGTKNIARIRLQGGPGVKGLLELEDPTFDVPEFLVACALIFRDWTSRG